MNLYDDLVDLAGRVLSIRTTVEALKYWPAIADELRAIVDVLRAKPPSQRRNPGIDQAADWLRRNIFDASLPDEAKLEAEVLIAELKRLVGAGRPELKPAPAPKRNWARQWRVQC